MDRALLYSLREKYVTLRALRLGDDGGDPRGAMRSVAERWPGALRELDELPMETLEGRIRALEAALDGASIPRWAPWLADYHGWMRAALQLKRHAGRDRDVAERWVSERYVPRLGEPSREALAGAVEAIVRPVGGRLSRGALAWVAARHGVTPGECEALAFPPSPLRGPR